MNDSDRIAVMIYQLLMHYEVELDEKIDNCRHNNTKYGSNQDTKQE